VVAAFERVMDRLEEEPEQVAPGNAPSIKSKEVRPKLLKV